MSRSYKHVPITGITTGESDKWGKVKAHCALRRAVRMGNYDARLRDVSNPYDWPKDGKYYHAGEYAERAKRK